MFSRWTLFLIAVNGCCGKQRKPQGPTDVHFRTVDLKTSLVWATRPEWRNYTVEYQVQTCNSDCTKRSRWTGANHCRKLVSNKTMECKLHDLSDSFFGFGRVRAFLRTKNTNSSHECTCTSCACTKFSRTNIYRSDLNTSLSAPMVVLTDPQSPTSATVEVKLPSKQIVCQFGSVEGLVTASVIQEEIAPHQCDVWHTSRNLTLKAAAESPFTIACEDISLEKTVQLQNLFSGTKYCIYAWYSARSINSDVGFADVFETSSDQDSVTDALIALGCFVSVVFLVIVAIALMRLHKNFKDYVKHGLPSFLEDVAGVGQCEGFYKMDPICDSPEGPADYLEYIILPQTSEPKSPDSNEIVTDQVNRTRPNETVQSDEGEIGSREQADSSPSPYSRLLNDLTDVTISQTSKPGCYMYHD